VNVPPIPSDKLPGNAKLPLLSKSGKDAAMALHQIVTAPVKLTAEPELLEVFTVVRVRPVLLFHVPNPFSQFDPPSYML
jgi:hypothetical protein